MSHPDRRASRETACVSIPRVSFVSPPYFFRRRGKLSFPSRRTSINETHTLRLSRRPIVRFEIGRYRTDLGVGFGATRSEISADNVYCQGVGLVRASTHLEISFSMQDNIYLCDKRKREMRKSNKSRPENLWRMYETIGATFSQTTL